MVFCCPDLELQLFLIGLILQVISFLLFTIIYIIFLRRVAQDSKTWQRDARESKFDDWRYLAGTVVVTCVCILVSPVSHRTLTPGG